MRIRNDVFKQLRVEHGRIWRGVVAAMMLLAGATAAHGADEAFVFVVLDRATVQDRPAHFASILQTVSEGDRLNFVSADEGWVQVGLTSAQDGYIRESAVVDKAKS